jgi:hypothetical protein
MRGVLTLTIEFWIFGSLEGLPIPRFGNVNFLLTLSQSRVVTSSFCNVCIMLHLMPKLFASYYVPISRYFATLCWVRYLYHNYVGKITWCRIFWWFYQSPNLSSSHSSWQVTLLAFSGKFGLLFVVWTIAPAFLRYWDFFVPALVTHFQ